VKVSIDEIIIMKISVVISLIFAGIFCGLSSAGEVARDVDSALQRGMAMVTGAASRWQQNKTCFTCHHQTLPMLATTEAGKAGLPLDQAWLNSQAATSHRYFENRIDTMLDGDHVPGGATTAGYGFWALSMADRASDETTTAMVAYLLQIQGVARLRGRESADLSMLQNGRWTTSCIRPPLQGSDVADTVLSLVGMEKFVADDQREALANSRKAAEKWLAQAPLITQEDRVWRLWGLHLLGGDADTKGAVRETILAGQRDDGGWARGEAMESEAFSTGQTVFILCETGMPPDDPKLQQGRDFLLRTQLADGSWMVESRLEKKAQPYFENGDPHGEHQFLSIAATSWATAALARLLPRGKEKTPQDSAEQ